MGRTRQVVWIYQCDDRRCVSLGELRYRAEVARGDSCSTGRGTEVHDQADADAVVRQAGWTIGTLVLCPAHARASR